MFFSNCCWMKELAIWSQTGNSCHPQLKKNLVVLTAFSFLITLAYINFQDVSVSLQVNANMKGLFKAWLQNHPSSERITIPMEEWLCFVSKFDNKFWCFSYHVSDHCHQQFVKWMNLFMFKSEANTVAIIQTTCSSTHTNFTLSAWWLLDHLLCSREKWSHVAI